MSKELGVSDRQIKKYLQRLTELKLIERQGGRKNGLWKIQTKTMRESLSNNRYTSKPPDFKRSA